jgi:predicted dehydrogenase
MKVRLGFIGCGYMGQVAHLKNYVMLPDARLVALAEGRTKTAAEVAKRYGIEEVYPDHQSLLEKADVDGVVAILPFGLHYAVVPEVLEAKKHCLTEKPIGQNPKNAKKAAELARANNLIYHVGYMKRCDPASIFVKNIISDWRKSGEFGELRHLRVSMPPGDWIYGMERPIDLGDGPAKYEGQEAEPTPEWMSKEVAKDYVSFVNYYIHQVNLIRYLLGEDYAVKYADPSGVIMVAESDSSVPITLEMATYNLKDEWREDYVAGFKNGQITLSLPAPLARQPGRVQVYRNAEKGAYYEEPVMPPTWTMREQARIFVETIRDKKPCISPAEDAVKDLEVAENYIKLWAKAK